MFVVHTGNKLRRCPGRGTWNITFLGMSPTSQLFEVDVDSLLPPRRVSKLSRHNLRQSIMPPKAAAGRRGKGSVTVGSTHPAKVAAAKKKADVASNAATRVSPKRGAKTAANDRITAQLSPHERVPIASVASEDAEIDATVVAVSSTDPPPEKLNIPPLWNAWYSSCCQVLRYYGDGGALVGRCALCGNGRPGRKDVMLDPEQMAELKAVPCLVYDALTGTVARHSSGGLPHSFPRGQVRHSPHKFTDVSVSKIGGDELGTADSHVEASDGSNFTPPHDLGTKTTGLSDEEFLSADESPLFANDGGYDPATPTDNEVSRFSFFDRLKHYMEGNQITEANRASVEMCILVEAGASVRGMDPMKKEKKERVYFAKYVAIIEEIEDSMFSSEHLRHHMRMRYKNAKKDNTGTSLWRKYEAELREIRNFSKKIPGVGSLSELPSGSNQLKHMKMPLVESLWREKHPVM